MPLKRILFVDDEMLLRMALVPGLEDAGYTVDEAATGKRALDIFRERHLEICCAVVDVGLPDLKGDSLVAEFRAVSAQIGIVLATGYADIELRAAFGTDPNVRVLAKPYFVDELLAAIGAVESLPAAGAATEDRLPATRPE